MPANNPVPVFDRKLQLHASVVGADDLTASGVVRSGEFVIHSDKGEGIKYSENQDSVCVVQNFFGHVYLGCVDGVGGEKGARLASQVITSTLIAELRKAAPLDKVISYTESALIAAREGLLQSDRSQADEVANMKATVLLAEIKEDKLSFVNIGNSRGLLIRDQEIVCKTKDQSLMQELIDLKEISEEEALHHPKRNKISNSVGLKHGYIDPHGPEEKRGAEFKSGDIVFLGTDGVFDVLTNREVLAIINQYGADLSKCALVLRERIKQEVLKREECPEKHEHADDNVSFVLYRQGQATAS